MSDPAHAEHAHHRMVRVLECDPDLGADLDRAERVRATRELHADTARWS